MILGPVVISCQVVVKFCIILTSMTMSRFSIPFPSPSHITHTHTLSLAQFDKDSSLPSLPQRPIAQRLTAGFTMLGGEERTLTALETGQEKVHS
jgi:hypothetical protein